MARRRSLPSRRAGPTRTALESLESRLLWSVTALLQQFSANLDPIIPDGSGAVTLPRFDAGTGTLVGASVDWSLGIATAGSYSFAYLTNSNSLAEVRLSGTLQLAVPGAPDNPQAVSVNVVERQISGPAQTIQINIRDVDVAAGRVELTAAAAQAAGYVGTGAQPFAFDAYASSTVTSGGGGGAPSMSGTWDTRGRVGAGVTYDYFVPGAISGRVFSDRNPAKSVSGWTITVTGTMDAIEVAGRGEVLAAGTYSGSARTDAHGNYRLAGLRPGTYQVSVLALHGSKAAVRGTYTVTLGVDGQASGSAAPIAFDFAADAGGLAVGPPVVAVEGASLPSVAGRTIQFRQISPPLAPGDSGTAGGYDVRWSLQRHKFWALKFSAQARRVSAPLIAYSPIA